MVDSLDYHLLTEGPEIMYIPVFQGSEALSLGSLLWCCDDLIQDSPVGVTN